MLELVSQCLNCFCPWLKLRRHDLKVSYRRILQLDPGAAVLGGSTLPVWFIRKENLFFPFNDIYSGKGQWFTSPMLYIILYTIVH